MSAERSEFILKRLSRFRGKLASSLPGKGFYTCNYTYNEAWPGLLTGFRSESAEMVLDARLATKDPK